MTDTDIERIASWVRTSRTAANPAAAFEAALHDMRAAGFALPPHIVRAVRAELAGNRGMSADISPDAQVIPC